MGTEMIVVNENWSMPQCVQEMRKQAEDLDEIYYVYVVDNDYKLRGVFPLKKMITHPSVSKIKHVMETDPVSVKTDTPIDDLTLDFEKYDLVAMPVVDSIGRLVGQITVDGVMDEAREQSERDYQLASGLSGDVERRHAFPSDTRPTPLAADRNARRNRELSYPRTFRERICRQPRHGAVHPLIGGTGGNVGIQSSAIIVQGLANGSLDIKSSTKQLFKELGWDCSTDASSRCWCLSTMCLRSALRRSPRLQCRCRYLRWWCLHRFSAHSSR